MPLSSSSLATAATVPAKTATTTASHRFNEPASDDVTWQQGKTTYTRYITKTNRISIIITTVVVIVAVITLTTYKNVFKTGSCRTEKKK